MLHNLISDVYFYEWNFAMVFSSAIHSYALWIKLELTANCALLSHTHMHTCNVRCSLSHTVKLCVQNVYNVEPWQRNIWFFECVILIASKSLNRLGVFSSIPIKNIYFCPPKIKINIFGSLFVKNSRFFTTFLTVERKRVFSEYLQFLPDFSYKNKIAKSRK